MNDGTEIVVANVSGESVIGRITWGEFRRDNADDAGMIEAAAAALRLDGRAIIGGGAAPAFLLFVPAISDAARPCRSPRFGRPYMLRRAAQCGS